jgi:hypothetical protein
MDFKREYRQKLDIMILANPWAFVSSFAGLLSGTTLGTLAGLFAAAGGVTLAVGAVLGFRAYRRL